MFFSWLDWGDGFLGGTSEAQPSCHMVSGCLLSTRPTSADDLSHLWCPVCQASPLKSDDPPLSARSFRKQDPKHSTHSGGKTHFVFNSSNLTSFAVKPWNGTNLRKPLSQTKRMVGDRQDFPFL